VGVQPAASSLHDGDDHCPSKLWSMAQVYLMAYLLSGWCFPWVACTASASYRRFLKLRPSTLPWLEDIAHPLHRPLTCSYGVAFLHGGIRLCKFSRSNAWYTVTVIQYIRDSLS
jgi:hypothetical protein